MRYIYYCSFCNEKFDESNMDKDNIECPICHSGGVVMLSEIENYDGYVNECLFELNISQEIIS